MKSKWTTTIIALILSVSTVSTASADIKMKTKNTSPGNTSEGTIYIKGVRQRSSQSYGAGFEMVTITQCDLKRTVQINDKARTYMVTPMVSATSPSTTTGEKQAPSANQPTTTRRGGVVTYHSTITDTGERKKMFGFNARHIKSSMMVESSPDACYPSRMRIETDGWYIDFEFNFECDSDKPLVAGAPGGGGRPDCRDEIRFKRSGAGKMGYPILVTTTVYLDGGQTSVSTTEVVELTTTPSDAALFEVPTGYTEAKDYQELMGMPSVESITQSGRRPTVPQANDEASVAAVKQPGKIRVGVVTIANKTDRSPSLYNLRSRLISNIIDADVDAVPLDSRTPAEIEAEAKQKSCDYILYTDIALLKTSGKVGGLLGRATGVGGVKEKVEARLDFRLFPVSSSTAVLTSSATAKDESSEDASLSLAAGQEGRAVVVEVRKRK
ncbi:MAG: hypothetical protein AABO41_09555 [Acidobacteriota bacterium]